MRHLGKINFLLLSSTPQRSSSIPTGYLQESKMIVFEVLTLIPKGMTSKQNTHIHRTLDFAKQLGACQ